MGWDGQERRKNWRCSSHEQIAVDMGVIKEKVSKTNELTVAIVNEMKSVNDRCLTHIADYKVFNEHIEESKKKKSILSDRRFQLLLGVNAFLLALFLAFIKGELNGEHKGSAGFVRTDTQQER